MNNSNHRYQHEPECVFCGAFGPIEDNEECVSDEELLSRDKLAVMIAKQRDQYYALKKEIREASKILLPFPGSTLVKQAEVRMNEREQLEEKCEKLKLELKEANIHCKVCRDTGCHNCY